MLLRKGFTRIVWFIAGLLLLAPAGCAQEAADFFRENCVSCGASELAALVSLSSEWA